MTLTKRQIRKYLAQGGIRCPFCQCPDIEMCGALDIDVGAAYQPMTCLACGETWTDGYTLDRIVDE